METLNQYMTERSLPRSLQVSIRKHYRYFWSRRTVFEHEEEILSNLSTPLRSRPAALHVPRRDPADTSLRGPPLPRPCVSNTIHLLCGSYAYLLTSRASSGLPRPRLHRHHRACDAAALLRFG